MKGGTMFKHFIHSSLIILSLSIVLIGCNRSLGQPSVDNNFEDIEEKIEIEKKTEEVKTTQPEPDNEDNENQEKDNKSTDESSENNQNDWVLEEALFTKVEEIDDLFVILNPENILTVVNKEKSLPASYIPEELVPPNVKFIFGDEDIPKRFIRKDAAIALEQMFYQAEKEGMTLYAVSGYRAYETQQFLFNNQVRLEGEEKARQVVAYPGQSEHQTGLAMDISSQSVNFELTEQFGETLEGDWTKQNAHKFGFIIRYPKGKETVTGYQYEPWHLRFVGKEIATIIYEHNITLEEYFNRVKKI